ncbi:ABC transporter substrate-binding protein [Streptomyces sp. NPDC003442]
MEQTLDAALAQLTIRDRLRFGRLRFHRASGALVLQLEGEEATVRGWPRLFHERHRGVLPVNCPDELPAEETPEQQVVTELLAIAQGCGYDGRPAYRLPIAFPRFAAAFAALYVWRPNDGQMPAKQNTKIARMVKQAIAEERRYTLQEMKERAEALARDEQLAQQLGGLVGVLVKVADVCRLPHRRTVRWYRRKWFRGRVVTQLEVFRELRGRQRKPVADKQLLLVEALLADIDAHYGFFRRLNRARRPVILLPDVDRSAARRQIRDRLLDAYDDGARELRVHPVVIATSASGAAPPPRGGQPPVAAEEITAAVPDRFRARDEAVERWRRSQDVPLPSRVLQVRLASPPPAPLPALGAGRWGPAMLSAGTVAVVSAVLAGLLNWAPWDRADGCGERLLMRGADCVGVSDGTGVFMPGLRGMREVFAGIEAENERIAHTAHATVALMIPMESDNPAVRRQILSEVQGAYLGQLQANGSDAAPPIRLVTANPGRDYRAWRFTVDRLVDQEPELRMVVGFNLSLDSTQEAMSHLTNELKIPVVAGLVTSQSFANVDGPGPYRYPGLARVVSTSKDQAAALLRYDPGLARAQTALVADTRPGDSYDKSLRDAFTEARGSGAGAQDMTFASEGPEVAGVTPNEFETFAMNLCESKARVVYFAGRAFHLELFVKRLARTYCARKKSYTVISGSDATTLDERLDGTERALLRGDPGAGTPTINVLYAAPAHPDAWDVEVGRWKKRAGRRGAAPGDLPRHLVEPQRAMAQLRAAARAHAGKLGTVRFDDGRAIETHDVILTAAKALTKAAATTRTPVPSKERIKEDYENLNSAFRVQGAGGWICLTNAGNPYNKALAIVRLDPMRSKLSFEALAWPKGAPAVDDRCVVPQNPGRPG